MVYVPNFSPAPDPADPATFNDRAGVFVAELVGAVPLMNAQRDEVNDLRDAAEAAALTAVNAPGTRASSTTELTVTAASKSFGIQAGKALQEGMWLLLSATGMPLTWMAGPITAYNESTGAATVQVVNFAGTGSATAWKVSVIPPINLVQATAAQIWAGTANSSAFTPAAMAAAMAPQAVTFANPFAFSGLSGFRQSMTVTSTFSLPAPAALLPGIDYNLRITIGGAGGFTWSPANGPWEWLGDQVPPLPTAAGSIVELLLRALTPTTATAQLRRVKG